jgi:uracil-DNA glycosylase
VRGAHPDRRAGARAQGGRQRSAVRRRERRPAARLDGHRQGAFYDPDFIAILPMGFCYPGTGASGDLPPRPECAATWRARLLEQLPALRLTLVIGTYAQAWHLKPAGTGANLTATVGAWREQGARVLPLPHPSPRNNGWLQRNPWFEADVLPELKARVRALRGK